MFRFLRWDPSVLLALSHMLLMWFVQRRSDVIRQPRYFASRTINSVNVVSATDARGMELPPPFFNFLFTYLFSIKNCYIISSLFPKLFV
jgi:hypothetical protein